MRAAFKIRPGAPAALIVAAAIAPLLLPGYFTFQLTQIIGLAMTLVGLNVLTGWAGQPSLGQGAFFAVGAYASAILMRIGCPWPIALLVSPAIGAAIAYGVGVPILRLERTYLALATFALALALPQLLNYSEFASWLGGAAGLQIVRPAPPGGLARFIGSDTFMYWVALFVAVLATFAINTLLRSELGLQLKALRDHPTAASACGVDIARAKTLAFALSAACAGLGGSLYALNVQLVTPDSFTLFLSLTLLVGLTMGGVGTAHGAWLGAVFIQMVPSLAEKVSTAAPWAVFGVAVLLVVFVEPRGLIVLAQRLAARMTRHPGAIGKSRA